MFPCPHCGKPIDVGPPPKLSWYQYDPGGTRVSLGCGTLILIAIIVAMFSKAGNNADDIRALRNDIHELEQKIDRIDVKQVAAGQATPERSNQ